MSYTWSVGPTDTEMTSISDGRSHLITAQAFAEGIRAGRGRYQAACGAEVIAAPMASRPGPRCRHCPGGGRPTTAPATRPQRAAEVIARPATA